MAQTLIVFVIIVQIVIILSLLNNISKRKNAETAVLESAEQLRTLINASPDIICFKDDNGRWLETNQFTLELFGLQDVDYIGKTNSDFMKLSPSYIDVFTSCERSDTMAWCSGGPYRSEETIVKPDGTKYIFDTLKVPVFNSDGKRKGIVILGRDITEHKRNEELKEKALENNRLLNEAVEYDNLKTELFANISHELRTPLNIILSTLQLLDMLIKKGILLIMVLN
jgi:PAS domain S-box-containing protein